MFLRVKKLKKNWAVAAAVVPLNKKSVPISTIPTGLYLKVLAGLAGLNNLTPNDTEQNIEIQIQFGSKLFINNGLSKKYLCVTNNAFLCNILL